VLIVDLLCCVVFGPVRFCFESNMLAIDLLLYL